MSSRIAHWVLASAVVLGGASAALGGRAAPPNQPALSTFSPESPPAPADANGVDALPPGHPPIGHANGSSAEAAPSADAAPAAITWRAPSAWTEVPSASKMRLATYRVPRAKGDDADAELTVTRAGGSTDANVQRWIGQFDDAGKDTREERSVHGLKVTIVEVGGTYLGGKMGSSGEARRPGFRLLGAVVESPNGSSTFFKLTGPAATVRAARAAFDAMLSAVAPAR